MGNKHLLSYLFALEPQVPVSISKLLLNFAPVTLTGNTILHVGYRPYLKDTLKDLRTEHGQTHVFKRDGKDDRIIEIPVAEGAKPLRRQEHGDRPQPQLAILGTPVEFGSYADI